MGIKEIQTNLNLTYQLNVGGVYKHNITYCVIQISSNNYMYHTLLLR